MNPSPSLIELAQPLQAPNALPESISLSVGLIATTTPSELTAAAIEASAATVQARLEANTDLVDVTREIAELNAAKARAAGSQHEEVTTTLGELQTTMGVGELMGCTPPADILETAMTLQDLAERTGVQVAEAQADADRAGADFERESLQRMQAELELADAQPLQELAHHIEQDRQDLSRRGRLTIAIGGTVLSVSTVSAGIFGSEWGEQLGNDGRALLIAGTLFLGGVASGYISLLCKGRLARGQAQKLIKKARKAEASAR